MEVYILKKVKRIVKKIEIKYNYVNNIGRCSMKKLNKLNLFRNSALKAIGLA